LKRDHKTTFQLVVAGLCLIILLDALFFDSRAPLRLFGLVTGIGGVANACWYLHTRRRRRPPRRQARTASSLTEQTWPEARGNGLGASALLGRNTGLADRPPTRSELRIISLASQVLSEQARGADLVQSYYHVWDGNQDESGYIEIYVASAHVAPLYLRLDVRVDEGTVNSAWSRGLGEDPTLLESAGSFLDDMTALLETEMRRRPRLPSGPLAFLRGVYLAADEPDEWVTLRRSIVQGAASGHLDVSMLEPPVRSKVRV